MGDNQDESGLPLGDASHLLDEKPPATVERSIMPMPISVRDVTPEGEVLREPKPGDAPVAIMPGELVRGISPDERVADAKRMMEPCPACQFFHFLVPGSEDYMIAKAMISSFVSNLPPWMAQQVPGRNIEEWGCCQGAPHQRKILVHMANSCKEFRNKVS